MNAADFWGVVMPAWLGAVGTIAASVVALFAYLAGRSAQGGVKQLADGLDRSAHPNDEAGTAALRGSDGETHHSEPWAL